MRLGLNTFLVSSGFTDADIPLIERFQSHGAEVVELAVVDPAALSVPELKEALVTNGLPAPVICGAFGEGRDLRGSYKEREESMNYIKSLISLARDLGGRMVCGPFYSRTGRCGAHSDDERHQQLEQIAGSLRSLCREAEEADVLLAVEPLNRFETDCVNTIRQAMDLIDRVGSPALKIHIDTFHMNIEEEDSGAAIRQAGDLVGHVHASASHRGLLGRDQVDWDGVFTALGEIGYEGDVVIESFSRDNEVIARATSIWRDLYDSPDQLAIEGLRFLQNQRNRLQAGIPVSS